MGCYIRSATRYYNPNCICFVNEENEVEERWVSNSILPVFTLRGDLNIVSGDGQSPDTAYRFN